MSDLSIIFGEEQQANSNEASIDPLIQEELKKVPSTGIFPLIPDALKIKALRQDTSPDSVLREVATIIGEYCHTNRPPTAHMTEVIQNQTTLVCRYLPGLKDSAEPSAGCTILYKKAYGYFGNHYSRYNADEPHPSKRSKRQSKNVPVMKVYECEIDNLEEIQTLKVRLKEIAKSPSEEWDFDELLSLLDASFCLQIRDLKNESTSVPLLILNEWPILFNPVGAMVFFKNGCKVDPTDSLAQFLGTEQQALRYFCLWKGGVQAAKLDRAACLEMMGNQGQDSESISMISLLQMLGVVFGESMDHTLRVMTEEEFGLLPGIGEKAPSHLKISPEHPCLVGHGESLLKCTEFFLFVDALKVSGPFTFYDGFKALFPTYFMVKTAYHARKTMQFVERVIVKYDCGVPPHHQTSSAIRAFESFKADYCREAMQN